MKAITKFTLALTLSTGIAGAVAADEAAIKARQGQMQLYSHYLGLLGGMAKGAVPYDADKAGAAASSLAMLTKLDSSRLWPEGSDEMSADETRALPAIWENGDDVMTKSAALRDAAAGMEMAAGQGLEALQGAMGPLGGACGACHKAYRAPDN